jgi:type II secretory pathway pseudopilin PulG
MSITSSPKTGFTLLETLLVITLGLLISLITVAIFTSGLKQIQEIKDLAQLHSNAIFLSNTLSYWVKQGESLNTPSDSTLEIVFPDSSLKTISQQDENILIDGATFNASNIEITNLSFSRLARSVKVEFTLRIKGTEKTLSTKTTIAQRNNLQ